MRGERIIEKIEITTLVHATEDEGRVRKAVLNLLPSSINTPFIQITHLDGYYGDPITTLKLTIKNRKPATDIFVKLVSELSSIDINSLVDELPQRIDETKNLYIRIDKQKAFQGKFTLQKHDSIRLKIKLQIPHKTDPIKTTRNYIDTLIREVT
jgi:RNA binding exosome subunit